MPAVTVLAAGRVPDVARVDRMCPACPVNGYTHRGHTRRAEACRLLWLDVEMCRGRSQVEPNRLTHDTLRFVGRAGSATATKRLPLAQGGFRR